MIKILKPLPKEICVAVSGGVDSMVLLDFLRRRHNVNAVFFHHGTPTSNDALFFLIDYTEKNNIPFTWSAIECSKPPTKSQEEFWRGERYKFFHHQEPPVVTAHHLDDCVEQWIFSSLHGNPGVIPYQNKNVFRPILTTPKKDIMDWAVKNNIPWVEDKSNEDTKFMRNYIRHELMPHALKVNPGLAKVVKKKIQSNIDFRNYSEFPDC